MHLFGLYCNRPFHLRKATVACPILDGSMSNRLFTIVFNKSIVSGTSYFAVRTKSDSSLGMLTGDILFITNFHSLHFLPYF